MECKLIIISVSSAGRQYDLRGTAQSVHGRQPLIRTPLFPTSALRQPLFRQLLFRQYQCDAHWMSIYRTFVQSRLTCGCYIYKVSLNQWRRQLWLVTLA